MSAILIFTLLYLTIFGMGVALPLLFGLTLKVLAAEGGIVLLAVIGMLLYSRLVRPAQVMAMGMDLLREQDYNSRLAPVGQPDADRIINLFNDIMARLKVEALRVREQNHFLDLLIEASPLGIVSLGDRDVVQTRNSMACRLLGEDPAGVALKDLKSPLAEVCMRLGNDESETIRLSDTMVYRCTRVQFMDRGMPRPFLLIEILTDEVRRAERDAYGKVIRVIGHEVNNSMASIRSLLQLLLEIKPWGDDEEELGQAVEGCVHRAALLSDFISSYTRVVKIPPARLEKIPLSDAVAHMQPFLTSMASSAGVGITFTYPDKADEAGIDISLMEQAVINIVKNAIESIRSAGDPESGRINVIVSEGRRLTVTDNGGGISPEASQKLFTPFFSTKPSGQGLGLMFVAEILHRHNATFSLRTEGAETRFEIAFRP